MGLSVPLSETTVKSKRKTRGANGLTPYAKRLLVGASNFLDQTYGKNLCFHTATLPTDKVELKRLTLEKSKQILKYWRKVLGRYLSARGLNPAHIIICLELQKRGALHLHTVFPTKKVAGKWITPFSELDQKWRQCLVAVCSELANSDFSKSCRTEQIRKSAGRYLSKYLSKSTSKVDVPIDDSVSITWYSVGKELKEWIKENTVEKSIEVENLDFLALKELAVERKAVRNPSLVSVPNWGFRCFFGYCNSLEDLESLLHSLFRIREHIPISSLREKRVEKRKEEEKHRREDVSSIPSLVEKREQFYQCSLFNLASYQSLPSRVSS